MDFTLVDEYLNQLSYTDELLELPFDEREKLVFTANEMLLNYYPSKVISVKAVALQTKYIFEGESEEYAKYKRQGVKSMKVDDISFSFDTGEKSGISPDVVALIALEMGGGSGGGGRAFVGRLI